MAIVENGLIKGQFVGKTVVKTTKNLSFSVEIKPKYHTYEEPILEWGSSKSTIKAKYGTPYSESADGLIYRTSNPKSPIMMFVFESGKMSTCGVVCTLSSASTLADFLTERYLAIDVDMDEYSAKFMHCFGKLSDPQFDYGVAMQYSSSLGGLLIAYMPIDVNKQSKSSNEVDFDGAFEALENVMK